MVLPDTKYLLRLVIASTICFGGKQLNLILVYITRNIFISYKSIGQYLPTTPISLEISALDPTYLSFDYPRWATLNGVVGRYFISLE